MLAQAGLPVPAAGARIGIVDRLFSRVGAADDLARGRSTFMVEMTETASILHQAGPRSLVVVDEIGRGTATLDGLAIAWAVLEALHNATALPHDFRHPFPRTGATDRRAAPAEAAHDAGQGMEAGRGVPARSRRGRRRPQLGRACRPARRRARARWCAAPAPSWPPWSSAPAADRGRAPCRCSPPPRPPPAEPEADRSDAPKRSPPSTPTRLTPREALEALYRLRALLPVAATRPRR